MKYMALAKVVPLNLKSITQSDGNDLSSDISVTRRSGHLGKSTQGGSWTVRPAKALVIYAVPRSLESKPDRAQWLNRGIPL